MSAVSGGPVAASASNQQCLTFDCSSAALKAPRMVQTAELQKQAANNAVTQEIKAAVTAYVDENISAWTVRTKGSVYHYANIREIQRLALAELAAVALKDAQDRNLTAEQRRDRVLAIFDIAKEITRNPKGAIPKYLAEDLLSQFSELKNGAGYVSAQAPRDLDRIADFLTPSRFDAPNGGRADEDFEHAPSRILKAGFDKEQFAALVRQWRGSDPAVQQGIKELEEWAGSYPSDNQLATMWPDLQCVPFARAAYDYQDPTLAQKVALQCADEFDRKASGAALSAIGDFRSRPEAQIDPAVAQATREVSGNSFLKSLAAAREALFVNGGGDALAALHFRGAANAAANAEKHPGITW